MVLVLYLEFLQMKRITLFLLIFGFLSYACNREEIEDPATPNPSISNSIEEPFVEYVERFLAEGEKRGYTFSKQKLILIQEEKTSFPNIKRTGCSTNLICVKVFTIYFKHLFQKSI